MLIGAFMWALSYGPPSFGRECRLGLALRRQESLVFECSHAALPSRGHRSAIDIVPHTSQHILSYLSHTFWLGSSTECRAFEAAQKRGTYRLAGPPLAFVCSASLIQVWAISSNISFACREIRESIIPVGARGPDLRSPAGHRIDGTEAERAASIPRQRISRPTPALQRAWPQRGSGGGRRHCRAKR